MKRWRHGLTCLLLMHCLGLQAATRVELPTRDFGYVIGDILVQRIQLGGVGHRIEFDEIPPAGRIDAWLDRLSSTLIGNDASQQWLELRYQIINAPTELVRIALPQITLVTNGEPLVVDAWPFSVSPLIPAIATESTEAGLIRTDRPPLMPDARAASQRLRYAGIALAINLLGWSVWWIWRQHVDARQLPFARVYHDLGKLDRHRLHDDPQVWIALHRAFNHVAGRSISSGSISLLLQQVPWLTSLQTSIEAFYAASTQRFFKLSTQPRGFALDEFSKSLYLAEKRQAGGRSVPPGQP